MSDKERILALDEALHIRRLYPPFSLDDALFDFWIMDELPKDGEYQREIRAALHILKPKAEERVTCLLTVRYALGFVKRAETEQRILSPRSKKSEEAMERLTAALKKARIAYNNLPPVERVRFGEVFDLEGAIYFCEQRTDEWKKTPMPRARHSHTQRAAVEMAYKLVQYWLVKKKGLHEAVRLTRNNDWHRLSSILFDNSGVDLLDHMTRYKRLSREPGAK
ncbi:hypothetical protein [Bradyrhizobium sp. 6(2017)]|uniref:hypothetical protein n=1 Tax=Bradyrhizobium sp. 6(2017) TaxID=1197460 RepID=UPI0013E13FB3|nr:hypothetical protein [Bradyrhizobium sp. 6(2017)]QIG96592.1 hypothetical protein G6P99_32100 [Bradyrhizobium sp. 6(2017)]